MPLTFGHMTGQSIERKIAQNQSMSPPFEPPTALAPSSMSPGIYADGPSPSGDRKRDVMVDSPKEGAVRGAGAFGWSHSRSSSSPRASSPRDTERRDFAWSKSRDSNDEAGAVIPREGTP